MKNFSKLFGYVDSISKKDKVSQFINFISRPSRSKFTGFIFFILPKNLQKLLQMIFPWRLMRNFFEIEQNRSFFWFASGRKGNFSHKYSKQSASSNKALAYCFIKTNLICRGGKRNFFVNSQLLIQLHLTVRFRNTEKSIYHNTAPFMISDNEILLSAFPKLTIYFMSSSNIKLKAQNFDD